MSGFIKKSTGLTGLAVQPQARKILADLYQKTFKELQKIPPQAGYRRRIEELTRFRYNVVQENTDILKIESTIQCGQVEELIQQAENELLVLDVVAQNKTWELKDPNKPPVVMLNSK